MIYNQIIKKCVKGHQQVITEILWLKSSIISKQKASQKVVDTPSISGISKPTSSKWKVTKDAIKDDNKDLGCNIFENKIKRLSEDQKIMEQKEFLDYFSQNVSNVQNCSIFRENILKIFSQRSILMEVNISAKKN